MARQKSEKVKRREEMLTAYNKLDSLKQLHAIMYVEKLVELQELEDVAKQVDEYRKTGTEFCSFCGKKKDEAKRLFKSQANVCICDECVQLCTGILEKDMTEKK